MPYTLTIKSSFSSAHQLKGYQGGCENLHGHNWAVEVSVISETLNDIGLAVDFRELKKIVKRVLKQYDHVVLNDHPDFREKNPTAENIACAIYKKMGEESYGDNQVRVDKITVWETEGCSASYSE
ncbi:MAG: 6-carboxytetrahydropterin synthase QueD [Nitrospinota bacterium]|nr:6-carboxytetrahydropterin synthase QueD [Nitrospinota bacterium]